MATDGRTRITAAPERWRLLGDLLRLRREDLGYRYRPGFCEARGINIRMVVDIERAPTDRQNTFQRVTLRDIAQAYQVTFDSMLAVLRGEAGELAPAVPAPPEPAPAPDGGGWLPPLADPAQMAAARPHADEIWERLHRLAAAGVTDPDGAALFPDSPADARTWDDPQLRRAWSLRDRVWLIADLRAFEAARRTRAG